MKIAIICSRLGYGGAEHVAVTWANGFVNRGHEVILISNLFEEQTYFVDKQIRLYNLVSTCKNKIVKWGSAILNVGSVVKRERPDVIIGVMGTCSLLSKIGTIGLKVPVIATEHNSFERPNSAPFGFWIWLSKFCFNKLYKHVTILTHADRDVIGNRLKNVSVMPNPLALRPLFSIPSKEKVVLAVGRLEGWHVKGFDVLVRAWARVNGQLKIDNGKLSSKGESWKLQIAGTGSEENLNYLKQLCRENGVEESVEFLGFRKDMEKLYQDASIFVLSSRYEGFGLVLIEAMSQGCACVACDYKGRQREIMCPQGQSSKFDVQSSNNKVELCETGILCEPDNVESLAAGIQKIIEDDEYRESVRVKAIERSKYYSIENTMDRWETLLKQVTGVKQL